MNNGAIFRKLSKLRAHQKQTLPFLASSVDVDIVLMIGLSQESGKPIGTTTLFAAGFAPSATVSRRLRRLKDVGAITEKRSAADARRIELRLHPTVLRQLGRLLQRRD
jgi:hypothetical protein